MQCTMQGQAPRVCAARGALQTTRAVLGPQCMPRSRRGLSINGFQLDIRKVKDVLARVTDSAWDRRLATLKEFYTHLSRETTDSLLAPDFKMCAAGHEKKFNRDDYLSMLYDTLLPSIPDFQWCSATTNEIDSNGFVVVTVRASGHHTGQPFSLPGLPAIPPSGRHFCLEEEAQMVRVENGKVKYLKVFLVPHAGPLALYTALGGSAPVQTSEQEQLPIP